MKIKSIPFIIIIIIIIVFGASRLWSQEAREQCSVTYVANDGFLYETKTGKVLIDALFGGINGNWYDLIKFRPEINSPGDNANSAYVSPDGKYLFFSSSRKDPSLLQVTSGTPLSSIIKSKSIPGTGASAIYWVNAKIIEELRPKN